MDECSACRISPDIRRMISQVSHSAGQASFLRIASIAAIVTAVTTIGVHFITFQADTFEQRLLLARDPLYLAQKWMIILHCLMVIVSMYGAGLIARKYSGPFASLGFVFFVVFGITEIARMFSVLGYLNPLREKYLAATDETIQGIISLQMESFGHVSLVLFLIFIFAFALGNLFYGLGLSRASANDKWIGYGFLLWALLTFSAFGNTFWESEPVDSIIEGCNKVFQPAFRLVIGVWLWRHARRSV